jgi:uncharacterized YigZ family protein
MEYERFTTLKETTETKIQVKGSVFYCYSNPVQNPDEAHSILENLKKKYYDATHICYALNLADNTVRYSDSGEPSGTAGIKIFNAIKHFNLTNVLVVVIRYFGGIKLGIGPLGKAYYNAAYANLDAAIKLEKKKYIHLIITSGFEFIGSIYKLASLYDFKITNKAFSEVAVMDLMVLPENYIKLVEELKNISNGRIQIKTIENLFY